MVTPNYSASSYGKHPLLIAIWSRSNGTNWGQCLWPSMNHDNAICRTQRQHASGKSWYTWGTTGSSSTQNTELLATGSSLLQQESEEEALRRRRPCPQKGLREYSRVESRETWSKLGRIVSNNEDRQTKTIRANDSGRWTYSANWKGEPIMRSWNSNATTRSVTPKKCSMSYTLLM